jgi:hypothetical protein
MTPENQVRRKQVAHDDLALAVRTLPRRPRQTDCAGRERHQNAGRHIVTLAVLARRTGAVAFAHFGLSEPDRPMPPRFFRR